MPLSLTRRSGLAAAAVALACTLSVARAATDAQVTIDNYAFNPPRLTVFAGTKVTFTNRDDDTHTVVSAGSPPMFKSPPLDTDDSFAFTFTTPGTYGFFCSLHPHMQGTIVVQ